jgi:hypothetical protein|tara:strand:- start:8397 stop:8672 length:276 start_codon:yes stop_codon:yes gene_type:complete
VEQLINPISWIQVILSASGIGALVLWRQAKIQATLVSMHEDLVALKDSQGRRLRVEVYEADKQTTVEQFGRLTDGLARIESDVEKIERKIG